MSYTLRQVQTLLTKPELELFQASRATVIKDLTERQLSSKITRTRTLRAKYRDLFQRQTVKTQRARLRHVGHRATTTAARRPRPRSCKKCWGVLRSAWPRCKLRP